MKREQIDPQAVRTITDHWTDWLRPGDTIASATVVGAGLTISEEAHDDTSVTFKIAVGAGVALHSIVTATIHVVSAQGEADDHTLTWSVQHT